MDFTEPPGGADGDTDPARVLRDHRRGLAPIFDTAGMIEVGAILDVSTDRVRELCTEDVLAVWATVDRGATRSRRPQPDTVGTIPEARAGCGPRDRVARATAPVDYIGGPQLVLVQGRLREIADLSRQLVLGVERLERLARSGAVVDAERSRYALQLVRTRADRALGRAVLSDPPAETRFTTIEQWVRRARASGVRVPERLWRVVCPIWSVLGLILTVFAMYLLMGGHPGLALVTVGLRLAGSTLLPPPYSIGIEHASRTRTSVSGGLASHVSDLVALSAVGLVLAEAGQRWFGVLVATSSIVMVAGSVFRLASTQDATYVRRLCIERLLRNGSLVVGLAASLLASRTGVPDASRFLSLAAIGPAVFGLAEMARVSRRSATNRTRRERLGPDVAEADRRNEVTCAVESFGRQAGQSQTA